MATRTRAAHALPHRARAVEQCRQSAVLPSYHRARSTRWTQSVRRKPPSMRRRPSARTCDQAASNASSCCRLYVLAPFASQHQSWNSPRASNRTRSSAAGTRCGSRAATSRRACDPDRPAYCIQLPPPNVTGTLHMGHAFQQTLMDALIRYHRMRGYNTNWVVGTDHAGIATQIVVERQLEAEGKSRHDLGREKFVERVWAWKQQSGSTITRQMRRLGASANWTYADTEGQKAGYFTMDARMSRAVVEVFVRLLRGRADLPRQAPGELGSGARHRGLRPRGRQRGGGRQDLGDPLSRRRWRGSGDAAWSSPRRAPRRCSATWRSR